MDSAQLPAVVTLMGKGCLPDSHPLNYGAPGMHGSKYANWALNKADLVIAVGSRFDDRVTGKVSAFAPGAKVIHFDIDAAEVGKIRHAEIPVVGPLKLGLAQLAEQVRRASQSVDCRPRAVAAPARGLARAVPVPLREGGRRAEAADGDRGAARRRRRAPDDVIWTTGVGQHQMWAMQYLVCDQPRSFITSGGLGTMGYGLPAAIGAKAARPDATVVCIDGDGCFQMTCQELATAALERLPIVAVVINNGWLGMVRQWQEMFYDERFAQTHLTHAVPDYAQLAEAFGCAGFTVESEDQLEDALRRRVRRRPKRRRRRSLRPGGEVLPDGARRRRRRRRDGSCPTNEEAMTSRSEQRPHDQRAGSRTSRARWRASRSSSRGAATTSRASPSGRPSSSDISRLTLRVDCSEHSLEQIEKQMHKLVNVLRVTELRPDEPLERELALFTVSVSPDKPRRARRAQPGRGRGRRRHRPRRDHVRVRRASRRGRGVRRARPSVRRARARAHRQGRAAPSEPGVVRTKA